MSGRKTLSGSVSVQFFVLPNTQKHVKWERAVVRLTAQITKVRDIFYSLLKAAEKRSKWIAAIHKRWIW